MIFSIKEIKVDFVLYPFPWLHSFDAVEGIRLLSFEDIIPMKLQAVSNRNAKKDYWDIASLLEDYPLSKMMKIFASKFPLIDIGFIIHSLTDFEKADTELNPVKTDDETTWNEIKMQVTNAVTLYTMSLL